MALFPSPLERTVASALLLLSTTPPPPTPHLYPINSTSSANHATTPSEGNQEKSSKASFSFSLIGSNSCSSDLTGEVPSEEVLGPHKQKIVSVEAGRHRHGFTNLKVVKKSRSKVCWSSGYPKVTSVKPETHSSGSLSTEASSLSRGSSAISSVRSQISTGAAKKPAANPEDSRKKDCGGSAHIRRRAEAILMILSGGSFSEVTIRRVLGDTPDTSKALRMLVKLKEVMRSGSGGRHDPFIYPRA